MSSVSVKQVAFSASLLAAGSGTVGPFNTHTPLVFRRVVSNIGNAYNPHTGIHLKKKRKSWICDKVEMIVGDNSLFDFNITQDFSLHQWEELTTLSSTLVHKVMQLILLEQCWSRMASIFLLPMNTRIPILEVLLMGPHYY